MSLPLDFIRPSNDELQSTDNAASSAHSGNDRAEGERRQLQEAAREQHLADSRAAKELEDRLASSENKRELMKLYGKKSFTYLRGYSIYCGIVILFQGFSPHIAFGNFFRVNGFNLDDTPLTVLVGSTAVSVIGLVAIMLRGLFDLKEPKDKQTEKTSSSSQKKS